MIIFLEAALAYASAGYNVLPVSGKIPLTEHGAHDATTDAPTIRAWWKRWPKANVAITLAGLVVIDIDPRNGGDIRSLPTMSATCLASTGGGSHLLFRAAPGAAYPGKHAPGVDIKSGAGAYIVVAPSLHASGRRYLWLGNSSPLTRAPAVAPAWLARSATGANPMRPPRAKAPAISIEDNLWIKTMKPLLYTRLYPDLGEQMLNTFRSPPKS